MTDEHITAHMLADDLSESMRVVLQSAVGGQRSMRQYYDAASTGTHGTCRALERRGLLKPFGASPDEWCPTYRGVTVALILDTLRKTP